jgi:hypothetical protein
MDRALEFHRPPQCRGHAGGSSVSDPAGLHANPKHAQADGGAPTGNGAPQASPAPPQTIATLFSLQKTAKFMSVQITYNGPLVSYLTYDDLNSALVDYSNLRRPRLDLRRLSLNYEGPNATVVDYL